MDILTKVCTKCKIEKEVTEFYKHKGGKHGVKGKCKKCHDIKSKEYRITAKKYHEDNKIEVKKLRQQVKEQQEYIDMLWDYIVSQTGMTEEEWKNL